MSDERSKKSPNKSGVPIDANTPIAGHYKMRMVRDGPWVAIKLWFAPSNDPITGEVLDRSPVWQCLKHGVLVPFDDVWPWCANHPITPGEYRFILDTYKWAMTHAPDEPEAAPATPIDINKTRPVF